MNLLKKFLLAVTVSGSILGVGLSATTNNFVEENLELEEQAVNPVEEKVELMKYATNYAATKSKTGYINDQENYTDVKLGVRTVDYNGCETIAIHNALKLSGKTSNWYKVVDYYNYQNAVGYYSRLWLNGEWGVHYNDIDLYLDNVGKSYTQYNTASKLYDKIAIKTSSVVIMSKWNDSSIFKGIHTVAIKITKPSASPVYTFSVYNQKSSTWTFSVSTVAEGFDKILKYNDRNGSFITGYLL